MENYIESIIDLLESGKVNSRYINSVKMAIEYLRKTKFELVDLQVLREKGIKNALECYLGDVTYITNEFLSLPKNAQAYILLQDAKITHSVYTLSNGIYDIIEGLIDEKGYFDEYFKIMPFIDVAKNNLIKEHILKGSNTLGTCNVLLDNGEFMECQFSRRIIDEANPGKTKLINTRPVVIDKSSFELVAKGSEKHRQYIEDTKAIRELMKLSN